MNKLFLILLSSFLISAELEVEGDLKVTGNFQLGTIDSLQQVIITLQTQIIALQTQVNYLSSQLGYTDCNGVIGGDGVDVDEDGICDNIDNCVIDCGGSCNNENVELWTECYNIEETTSLLLANSGLTGEIPSEIWEMTNLENLYLGNNQLIGEIPNEVENLMSLNELSLNDNQLT